VLIYVNPAQVRMIVPVAEADFTLIVFDKDHQVIVSVPIEDVRQKLFEIMFEKLTGKVLPDDHAISENDSIFVKRYAHGGMSSGHVSPSFWSYSALPLLCSRFNEIRTTDQGTKMQR
jgi:hypothetical protein